MSDRNQNTASSLPARALRAILALVALLGASAALAVPHTCALPYITQTQCANVAVNGTSTCTITETGKVDLNCVAPQMEPVDAAHGFANLLGGTAYTVNQNPAVSTCLAIGKIYGVLGAYPQNQYGYYYPLPGGQSCVWQIVFHPTTSGSFSSQWTTAHVWTNTVAVPASCTQQQTDTCVRSDGTVVPNSSCNAATQPPTSQVCHSVALGC